LIDHGAKIDLQTKGGKTALIHACRKGHEEIVKELINRGADLNIRDKEGMTALINVCLCGKNSNIVEILKQSGADINQKDNKK